jgi:hypothetical protein
VYSGGANNTKRGIAANGLAGVENYFNSGNHSFGSIRLVTAMKCCLKFSSSAPKARPMSLFIFGGESDVSTLPDKVSKGENTMRKLNWHEDSFSHLTTGTAVHQIVVLSSQLGTNLMSFVDPVSLSVGLQIRLDDVSWVGPSDKVVNSITIIDRSAQGFKLDLQIDGNYESDSGLLTSRWLQHISMMKNFDPQVKIIIKKGYLQKRGRLNTAFRWRWFELSSDMKLRYFKGDNSRAYKGVIDLAFVDDQGVSRSDLELILHMRKINRTWILKGENEKEAEEWILVIRALFELNLNSLNKEDNTDGGSDHEDEEDDEEEEDEDQEGESPES